MRNDETRQEASETKELHVAVCVNEGWARYVEPLVYSLSKHHPNQKLTVHLVYRELHPSTLGRLYQLDRVLHNIQMNFCYLAEGLIDQISVANYYLPLESCFRIMLPDILPNVDRVIYLDIDILVCGNLQELYRTDLGYSSLGAVVERDVSVFFPDHPIGLGIQPDRYFNSGVLLMDLARMRQENFTAKLIAFAKNVQANLRFIDQDLLNLYFKDTVVLLDGRYNYTNYLMRYESRPVSELAVLHYNGPVKPWFSDLADQERFMSYLIRYKDYQLEYQQILLDNR